MQSLDIKNVRSFMSLAGDNEYKDAGGIALIDDILCLQVVVKVDSAFYIALRSVATKSCSHVHRYQPYRKRAPHASPM
jgi:hypothetical protein